METLVPLAVAVPLLAAAVVMGLSPFYEGRGLVAAALAAALATTAICAVLLAGLERTDPPIVYWFAGYEPRDGQPVGIAFVVDTLPAAAATFAAAMVTAALVFSWRHFDEVGAPFVALMLVFMAAMVGFVLSGDLFNMFVFFELMTVAGIVLAAYRADQSAPLAGALAFAVVNTVGAFLLLAGIALLYGQTGALNLAEIAEELEGGGRPGGPTVVAFGLIVCGFLTKAAVVPFHFWMADAYAAAPAPVCLVFTAIMSELGLYGIARVLWSGFDDVFAADLGALRGVLVALGAATALLGAALCLAQRHLKRMLAFATVAYAGLFLVGVGLLTHEGLGGSAIYVLADGMVKAGLFIAVGIVQHRLDSVSEVALHGRARGLWLPGALFAAGAMGLMALPPFGPFLGKALIEESALAHGFPWVPAVIMVTEALTAAAVLRAAGRVFAGWGDRDAGDQDRWTATSASRDEGEAEEPGSRRDRTPVSMAAAGVALMVAGLGAGLIPGLAEAATAAAQQLMEGPQYLSAAPAPAPPQVGPIAPGLTSYLYAAGSAALALVVAAVALLSPARPAGRLQRPLTLATRGFDAVRAAHSGHVGEYVGWLAVGAAGLTGLLGVLLV